MFQSQSQERKTILEEQPLLNCRTQILTLITLLLILPVLPIQKAEAVTWSTPEQITNSLSSDNFPSALTATDGKVWLVWDTTRTGRWNIFYKTFDGTTWSPDTQITSELFSNKAPTIVQLRNGTILVIYQWYRTDNWDIYLRAWRGSYWSEPLPVVVSPYIDGAPSASITADGTLWLTWERRLTSTNADIYYKTYSGGAWSPGETPLITGTIDEIIPTVLATREGRIIVSWTKLVSGSNYDVYYQYRDAGIWSTPRLLAGTNDFEMGWGLAQDRNGILWLFYSRERSAGAGQFQDEVYYSTSTDGGNTWCCNTQLTSDPPGGDPIQDTESRAIQGPDKRLWLFWDSDRSSDWEVWLMKTDPILTHDAAAVSIAPTAPIVTSTVKVTGQVANPGDYQETLQVNLRLNGTIVSTWTLSLAAGSTTSVTTTITVDWKNGAPVSYQLTLTVSQVTGEPKANLSNNSVSQTIKLYKGPGFGCSVGTPCLV